MALHHEFSELSDVEFDQTVVDCKPNGVIVSHQVWWTLLSKVVVLQARCNSIYRFYWPVRFHGGTPLVHFQVSSHKTQVFFNFLHFLWWLLIILEPRPFVLEALLLFSK
jgi:hypothetical protein